jgi:hypothetical protein
MTVMKKEKRIFLDRISFNSRFLVAGYWFLVLNREQETSN